LNIGTWGRPEGSSKVLQEHLLGKRSAHNRDAFLPNLDIHGAQVMTITVILCTYNRSECLSKALESVAASTMPTSIVWEVLVVDNNSSDRTREVVQDFSRREPSRFRYLFEPKPGKSHALNAGIREARGDVLAFIDDDVIVERNWLRNLTAALVDNDWVGSGGRILPANTFSPPPWLPLEGPNNMGGILALFDLGDTAVELDQPPFGTNMAFQKRMFEKYGGFRIDLGPRPGSQLRNEDTEFGRRLLKARERLRYEPSAVVYHRVPEDRLRKEYFLAWWFDLGRATMREIGRRRDILGIPRPYLSILKHGVVLFPIRTLRWVITFDPQSRFYRKCWVWKTFGEIVEIYHRSFGTKRMTNNAIQ
jgi:glycosyltransferase involved in cell wall biosynthesis